MRIPKPGDRIKIIAGSKVGEIHTVVKSPSWRSPADHMIWIKRPEKKEPTWFSPSQCEIVEGGVSVTESATGSTKCRYCNDTGRMTLLNWSVDCEECKQKRG